MWWTSTLIFSTLWTLMYNFNKVRFINNWYVHYFTVAQHYNTDMMSVLFMYYIELLCKSFPVHHLSFCVPLTLSATTKWNKWMSWNVAWSVINIFRSSCRFISVSLSDIAVHIHTCRIVLWIDVHGVYIHSGCNVGYMSYFCTRLQIQNVAFVHTILRNFTDVLVLGVGDTRDSFQLNSSVLSFMAKYHISIEVLSTEQACSTFNFLNAERRCIAGALIPPLTLRVTEDDVVLSKQRHKRLYETSDDEIY